MTTLAVIPARYGSVRFPGKPLVNLAGKPLVCHVVDRAREARTVDDVVVATDDERIVEAVEKHGGRAMMTSADCASGSDRIAEVVRREPDADVIVNVQGDEPLMPPEIIDRAVDALLSDPDCAVATAMIRIRSEEDYRSTNVVKVVLDASGRALYFSRSPIPSLVHVRDAQIVRNALGAGGEFWGYKHFGLYAYRREALLRFVELAPAPLETAENLEQLRFIENGMTIRVVEAERDSIGVDTPEDLEAARRLIEG